MIKTTEVKTVGEFLDAVCKDSNGWQGFPWFRGHRDGNWKLTPGLFREHTNPDALERDEENHNFIFSFQAPSLGNTPEPGAHTEWLLHMQHRGMRTRLLDWTEGALIAAFFALWDWNADESENDPAVWMLAPTAINRPLLGDILPTPDHWALLGRSQMGFEGESKLSRIIKGITDQGHSFVVEDSERASLEESHFEQPVTVTPLLIDSQMAAQKSRFTIHGTDHRGIDEIFSQDELVENGWLRKYVIHAEHVAPWLNDLMKAGISKSTLFPSHEGLAQEIMRIQSIWRSAYDYRLEDDEKT